MLTLKDTVREEGFTLIELLVVILIIGILAAIAIPMFLNQRHAAVAASIKSDIKMVSLAHETAISKNPRVAGTLKKADLNATAAKLSDGATVGTWFVQGKGYCVVGYNRGSDVVGNGSDQQTYLWFDSALGGFVAAPDKDTPPSGGACANPRPSTMEQAWYYASTGTWQSNY